MIRQTVNWAHYSPEKSRLFWRKFFYELKGTGWVIVLMAILAIVDFGFLKINYIWIGFLGILFFYLCIAAFGYFSTRKFSRDVGEALYCLDEMNLNVKHNLAEVNIPTKNISKVIEFPEGVYVQYGPRLMLTLPNGPVQQALAQQFKQKFSSPDFCPPSLSEWAVNSRILRSTHGFCTLRLIFPVQHASFSDSFCDEPQLWQ